MFRVVPILLIPLICSPSQAGIYRWVDADGRVNYSDRPAPEAERLDRRLGVPTVSNPTPRPGPGSPDEAYPGPYARLNILVPAPDEILTDSGSGIPVSVQLDPALIGGHRLLLLLDGNALPVEGAYTQFSLTGIGPGGHRLQLQIRGTDDRLLAQSAPRTFQIRQPRMPGQLP